MIVVAFEISKSFNEEQFLNKDSIFSTEIELNWDKFKDINELQ